VRLAQEKDVLGEKGGVRNLKLSDVQRKASGRTEGCKGISCHHEKMGPSSIKGGAKKIRVS